MMDWKQLLSEDRIRAVNRAKSTSDLRSEFEKDYHRIIGSASFRRLQDKTQVFPLDKSDFVRTRLTHSLEVSSLAKSLGQNISAKILQEKKDSGFLPQYHGAVCDILQCAGLLHDIGNPPFGHFGEEAIRDWFRKSLKELRFDAEGFHDQTLEAILEPQMVQDFCCFEGNTQAFRLVTKLHYLVDAHGMNLTKALLGTIIKYPGSSLEINKDSGDIHMKKMGYYYADRENFNHIQQSLGTAGRRHPLTYLLEAADDIAYRTADIEDAFKKGCIGYDELVKELKLFGAERVSPEFQSDYDSTVEKLERLYEKAIGEKQKQPDLYAIQNWIVNVQGRMIFSVTDCFMQQYETIMSGTYQMDLFSGSYADPVMSALGDIAYRYVFLSAPILNLEIGAETILTFLLDKFVRAALYYDTEKAKDQTAVEQKLMALISDNYMSIYECYGHEKPPQEKLYLRLLLVTDFICGMTDSYAKDLYQQFNGIQ